MVRVNEDTWALCIFCVITRDACSLPDGPGQRWAEAKYR